MGPASEGSHGRRGPILRPWVQTATSPTPCDFGPSPLASNLQGHSCAGRQYLKCNGNWSSKSLKAAIRAMEEGCKIREAARYFDILPSSLSDHVYRQTVIQKWGRKGV
jgi:hypothetical protein